MQSPIIGVVFATMNRKEVAMACVEALASQTRLPDLVVVADNVSRDGTADTLEALDNLPFPLVVHRMRENRGNAGGVEEAMELAFDKGADAVWILDDDSWPRSDALEKLMERPWRTDQVRHSIQIDPKTDDLTWPMQVFDESSGWSTISSLAETQDHDHLVTRNNWTGSLVPREVRDQVGPVMGALFIRGEDEEYPWRMQCLGVTQTCACRSVLDHPGPAALRVIRILGKSIFYEPGLSDWKLYYKVRNMLWLQRRKRGLASMIAMGIAYAWIVVRHDGFDRIPILCQAATDGLRGRLGRWRHHPVA